MGRKHGLGILVSPDGKIIKGKWVRGELKKFVELTDSNSVRSHTTNMTFRSVDRSRNGTVMTNRRESIFSRRFG